MVSPNLPTQLPSSPPLSKPIPDPSVLMTITLEPLVRRSTASGKDAILNVLPPLRATHPDQPLTSTSAKSTNLLQRFIEDFNEIESYQ